MSRRGIRIVPKDKDPMTPLVKYSMKRDWSLTKAVARNPSGESGEIIYLDNETNTHIILRDDTLVGTSFFTIWGPAEAKLADEIRALIPSYTEEELIAWWDRAVTDDDVDDKVDAVLFMGVGAPSTPMPAIQERLLAGLRDADKDVRNAAVVGASYADWPDVFRSALEELVRTDSDETARSRAKIVLDTWAA